MKRFILGIDPGLDGALAFYDPLADELAIFDMPTHNVAIGNKVRRKIDTVGLASIVSAYAPATIHGIIEEVNAMPKQGVTSSFSFGFAAGCVQMAVAAFNIPHITERPNSWKKAMRLTSNKTDARREASRLLPKHAGLWARVKDDGRAEAALLAYYIAKQIH